MKDYHGKEIEVGDFVRHIREPLPKGADFAEKCGHHCHNFFGVKVVKHLLNRSIECTDGYVVTGALTEIVQDYGERRPYVFPLRATLLAASED